MIAIPKLKKKVFNKNRTKKRGDNKKKMKKFMEGEGFEHGISKIPF